MKKTDLPGQGFSLEPEYISLDESKDRFQEGMRLMSFWIEHLDKFTPFERQGMFSIISAKIAFVDVAPISSPDVVNVNIKGPGGKDEASK